MKKTVVKGQCTQMCPEKEIQMREREGLLHRLEILSETSGHKRPKADPKKVVKEYVRSAAGAELNNVQTLRPPEVLIKTVHYLIYEVVASKENKLEDIYGFVLNRLRSVRQDMIIQDLCDADCVKILEPMVYFHSYVSYIFCEENNLSSFSAKINNEILLECLKRILTSYESIQRNFENKNYELQYNNTNLQTILPNRTNMEAIYVLLHLGNFNVLTRALALKDKWKNFHVQSSINISISVWKGNYVRAVRLIKELPDMLSVVASLQLPKIRRMALQINCSAYHSRPLKVPIEIVKEQLAYNNMVEVINDCKRCAIEIDYEGIKYSKSSFKSIETSCLPTRCSFVEDKLQKCVLKILLGEAE